MGIVTEMNLLLQTKIPQRIAKPQQLSSICGVIPRGREKASRDLQIHDPGRPPPGESPAIQRGRKTQESVDKVKEGPKEFASEDPRVRQLGRTLSDEFAVIREKYSIPLTPSV